MGRFPLELEDVEPDDELDEDEDDEDELEDDVPLVPELEEEEEEEDDFPFVPDELVTPPEVEPEATAPDVSSGSSPENVPCAQATRESEATAERVPRKSVDCFMPTCVVGMTFRIHAIQQDVEKREFTSIECIPQAIFERVQQQLGFFRAREPARKCLFFGVTTGGAPGLALHVFLRDRATLVDGLLAFADAQHHLDAPLFEIELHRDDRISAAHDVLLERLDLAGVQENLSRTTNFVGEDLRLLERCNIHLPEPGFALLHLRVGIRKVHLAGAKRLYLTAHEHEAALDAAFDLVVEARAAVLDDALGVGFLGHGGCRSL